MLPAAPLVAERYTTTPVPDWAQSEDWTRLCLGDVILSNCLEWAVWSGDPVLPWVCDCCRRVSCATCRLAHVVRTNSQILWMQPYRDFATWDWPERLESWRFVDDSALIPMADWNRVRAEFPGFPGVEQFPRINSHDLINLWLQQRPPCAVPGPYDDFERHLRMHVIASHPLDIQVAFEVIAGFESQLEADPIELSGEFIDIGGDPDRGNTLYIDPENSPEFLAFGVSPSAQVILANQLLWQPACE